MVVTWDVLLQNRYNTADSDFSPHLIRLHHGCEWVLHGVECERKWVWKLWIQLHCIPPLCSKVCDPSCHICKESQLCIYGIYDVHVKCTVWNVNGTDVSACMVDGRNRLSECPSSLLFSSFPSSSLSHSFFFPSPSSSLLLPPFLPPSSLLTFLQ